MKNAIFAAAAAFSAIFAAQAELTLPALFTDHMVLQAGKPVHVWGSAAPGASVSVELSRGGDEPMRIGGGVAADENGAFEITLLDSVDASAQPHTLRVVSGGGERVVSDVLVGEVWLASGQSNMWWPLRLSDNSAEEIAAADHPLIRLFTVPNIAALAPQTDVGAAWSACSPQTVSNFSAVAYFFGRDLQKALPPGTPIGLINSSWGGTPAQSWTSIEALRGGGFANYAADYAAALDSADPTPEQFAQYELDLAAHLATIGFPEPPVTDASLAFAAPDTDDSEWTRLKLPDPWERTPAMANLNGVVWFRKTVEIPPEWAGKPLVLNAGIVDDADTTYFNGVQVGATGKDVPEHWKIQRAYAIPAAAVKAGAATIAIRVFDNFNNGGVTGGILGIAPADESAPAIDLSGDWSCHIEHSVIELPRPQEPGRVNAWTPSALYNAMIAPLVPYPIAGAIWYQGESNAGAAAEYEKLFPAMINDWRARWGYDFPFLWAQLANFMIRNPQPADTPWANLREAQTKTLSLPKTGQAILIDIGEAGDIHPRNKQDVGRRLALAARGIAYGHGIAYRGPAIKTVKADGDALILTFDNAEGLNFRGDSVNNFAIAGEDGAFVWAEAELAAAAGTITLRASGIAAPVFVRYAWGNNPVASLYNSAALPAAPFAARAE